MSGFNALHTRAFAGHKKTINSVSWNGAGDRLASGSSDCVARVWSVKEGVGLTSTLELTGHTKSVAQLAWDPCKEALLATAGSDKTVRVWDTRASKCVASVDTKGENISLAYRRDGTYVVVGNKKDHVSWIDTRTFQVVFDRSFSGETNEVGFDLSGLFYATTGLGTVDVYEGAPTKSDFKRVASLPAHAASCYCICFSPDGKLFAVGSADSLVSVWDRHELICARTMPRFKCPARTACFSHDSLFLASGGEDGIIDVAHVEDCSQYSSLRVGTAVNCIAWNPTSLLMAYVAERTESNRSHDVFLVSE